MFKLHAVHAQFGDSLLLEFGTPAKRRFVLIDGGPPRTYAEQLEPALEQIVGKAGELDLAVLSHVDNDHVVGLLDLFAALEEDDADQKPRRTGVAQLWHNSFQRSLDPDGQITQRLQMLLTLAGASNVQMPFSADAFLGVKEGYRLRTLAAQLDVPVNRGFADGLITVEAAKAPIKLGPLTLRVVGPTRANLDELRKKWLAWLKKVEEQVMRDPSTAANADKSVPNLSSIVLHAECGGKTMLLTGDARGDHIMSGLRTAKLLKNEKLHVDVLKVQHHGSDRNVVRGFFERLTADTYVISADGKHGNPDYPTLSWIVESAHNAGRSVRIVVTNATATTRRLLKEYKPAKYGYTLTVRPPDEHAITVPLA